MELRYADNELERQCTDAKYAQRKRGAQLAKSLQLRVGELRRAETIGDLLLGGGRWEEMKGDRDGQWSARLTKNWRLIIEPDGDEIVVWVIEIVDYH